MVPPKERVVLKSVDKSTVVPSELRMISVYDPGVVAVLVSDNARVTEHEETVLGQGTRISVGGRCAASRRSIENDVVDCSVLHQGRRSKAKSGYLYQVVELVLDTEKRMPEVDARE